MTMPIEEYGSEQEASLYSYRPEENEGDLQQHDNNIGLNNLAMEL